MGCDPGYGNIQKVDFKNWKYFYGDTPFIISFSIITGHNTSLFKMGARSIIIPEKILNFIVVICKYRVSAPVLLLNWFNCCYPFWKQFSRLVVAPIVRTEKLRNNAVWTYRLCVGRVVCREGIAFSWWASTPFWDSFDCKDGNQVGMKGFFSACGVPFHLSTLTQLLQALLSVALISYCSDVVNCPRKCKCRADATFLFWGRLNIGPRP